jgi:propanediol utilization protein
LPVEKFREARQNELPMSFKKDLSKDELYTGVKTLVEHSCPHVHLSQQKLFTLFSVGFQYLLFRSSKHPGHYIIRIEDSFLADKLARKAKDETTRKFMQRLLVPRRLNYGNATFHLDYFNLSTWGVTKDLPKERIQGAMIVKNTANNPMIDEGDFRHVDPENMQNEAAKQLFGEHYYLNSLKEFCPRTVTIAFETEYLGTEKVLFPFIEEENSPSQGVKIHDDVEWDD